MPHFFSRKLLAWHAQNPRNLPWAFGPRDPYHIWISEVIMQQTRIEQGGPYYNRFVARFPDVESLAKASLDEVLHAWQGLGYYTRARNLHKAAGTILNQYRGAFPDTYEGLLALPGIGSYSASAIASFAYHLPFPVVDGNVKRVVSRFAGIEEDIQLPTTHELIRATAQQYMKGTDPADFNQAIMNFGALVCKPKNPLCASCPLSIRCYAFQHDLVHKIPVKAKKKVNVVRYFHFIVIRHRHKILLQRRDGKDIWHSLYTPLLLESNSERKPANFKIAAELKKWIGHDDATIIQSSKPVRQLLSHQTLFGRFHYYVLDAPPLKTPANCVWLNQKTWKDFGKPKMVFENLDWSIL